MSDFSSVYRHATSTKEVRELGLDSTVNGGVSEALLGFVLVIKRGFRLRGS